MSSLRSNLVKRIERLPKPKNVTGAMQPLFEAVSNSIHSTQREFKDQVAERGEVYIEVNTNRDKNGVWATVEDNGSGLDTANWEAFQTTDTDSKIDIGGKGVGRLMWLDCFETIKIKSTFAADDGRKKTRTFQFVLSNKNQFQNEIV